MFERWDRPENHAGHGFVISFENRHHSIVWSECEAAGDGRGQIKIWPVKEHPRVAHAVLPISGKGKSDWGYALVPILGPLIAGGIGAVIIRAANIA